MKTTLLWSAAALFAIPCALSGNAVALDTYGKVGVGDVAQMTAGGFDLDGELAYSAAIGIDDLGPFRVEAGVDHLEGEAFGAVNLNANALHVSGFFDLPLTEDLSAFAGVGYEWVEGSANAGFGSYDFNGTGLRYQAGVSWALSEKLALEISYTEHDADLEFADGKAGVFGVSLVFDL